MVFRARVARAGRGRRPISNVELMEEVRRLEVMEAGRKYDPEVGDINDDEEEMLYIETLDPLYNNPQSQFPTISTLTRKVRSRVSMRDMSVHLFRNISVS